MTSFLRALSDAATGGEQQDGPGGPTTTTTSMDPKVFWPVNGFILFLICIACCTCYWYGGLPWWRIDNSESRRQSDEAYRARILRRQEEEAKKRRGTPEKRQKALLRSFQRCKVHMVVQEGDLVDSKGEQPAALLGSTEEDTDSDNPELVEENDNDESSPKVIVEIPAEMATGQTAQEEGQVPFEEQDLGSESSEELDDYDPEDLAEVDLEAANNETLPILPSHDDDETAANGYLILRGSDFPARRRVPNCCAICLGCYEVGEQVVWSSNEKCAHAFHMTCLVDWLTKMRDGTPCPCCRAEFTDLEKHRRERRILWRADNAFNLNVVTL